MLRGLSSPFLPRSLRPLRVACRALVVTFDLAERHAHSLVLLGAWFEVAAAPAAAEASIPPKTDLKHREMWLVWDRPVCLSPPFQDNIPDKDRNFTKRNIDLLELRIVSCQPFLSLSSVARFRKGYNESGVPSSIRM